MAEISLPDVSLPSSLSHASTLSGSTINIFWWLQLFVAWARFFSEFLIKINLDSLKESRKEAVDALLQ